MSSRILRGGELAGVQPIQWNTLGGAPRARRGAEARPQEDDAGSRQAEQALQQRLQAEREQAYRQGEAAGRQAAQQGFEAELQRLVRTIEEVSGYRGRLRKQAERDVVELALAVAKRILRRQIAIDPDAVTGLVKAALESLSLREVTEVRVHPGHLARVESYLGKIGAPQSIKVEPDPALEAGALVLRTASGKIDASVETQLEEIARGFADALGDTR